VLNKEFLEKGKVNRENLRFSETWGRGFTGLGDGRPWAVPRIGKERAVPLEREREGICPGF